MKLNSINEVPICPECGHPRCPGCGGCTVHESATVYACPDCGYRGVVTGLADEDLIPVQPDGWGILQ